MQSVHGKALSIDSEEHVPSIQYPTVPVSWYRGLKFFPVGDTVETRDATPFQDFRQLINRHDIQADGAVAYVPLWPSRDQVLLPLVVRVQL